jgi:hypothetical protein
MLLFLGKLLLWVVVFLAILSMVYYFKSFWSQLGESARLRREGEKERKLKLWDGQKAQMR